MALVSAAGLALMAAGPLAMGAVGSGSDPVGPALRDEAPAAQSTSRAPPIADRAVVTVIAAAAAAGAGDAVLEELLGGDSDAEVVGEGDAVMASDAGGADLVAEGDAAVDGEPTTLANVIRVALMRDNRCPGEQQALVIIGQATRGWDVAAAGSALRLVGNSNDLCPAVSAALERSTTAAEASAQANAAPLSPNGGGTPGGSGGHGYQSTGG